jgi:hypothetical protein
MAIRTGVLEGVTSHAAALIQHCGLGVRAGFEQWQGLVAARQFVVAAAAIIGGVAGGASGAIERRELAVDIVLPTRGVRCGLHHLMAGDALVFRRQRWRHVLVAGEALRVRRGSALIVVDPETLYVRRRLYGRHVAGWSDTLGIIQMAGSAIGHAEPRRDFLRGIVTRYAVQHGWQGEVRETGAA